MGETIAEVPLHRPKHFRRRSADVFEFKAKGEYAVFIVDDQRDRTPGRSGYYVLAIESSFGGFAYAWGDPGRDFRAFLCGLNLDYVRGKMVGHDLVFDAEGTTRAVRREIMTLRRDGSFNREDAREAWPESDFDHECDFVRWMDAIDTRLYEGLAPRELSRQCGGRRTQEFTALYNQFWPLLRAALTEVQGG